MADLFERFQSILDGLIDTHENLLAMAEKQRLALTSQKLDEVSDLTTKGQILLAKQADWEKKRLQAVQEFAETTHTPLTEVTLMSIAHSAPQDLRETMESKCVHLREILELLQKKQFVNNKLLDNRLAYVDFMIDSLRNHPTTVEYSAKGTDQIKSSKTKLFDQKV